VVEEGKSSSSTQIILKERTTTMKADVNDSTGEGKVSENIANWTEGNSEASPRECLN
jgi:hypothetical protein